MPWTEPGTFRMQNIHAMPELQPYPHMRQLACKTYALLYRVPHNMELLLSISFCGGTVIAQWVKHTFCMQQVQRSWIQHFQEGWGKISIWNLPVTMAIHRRMQVHMLQANINFSFLFSFLPYTQAHPTIFNIPRNPTFIFLCTWQEIALYYYNSKSTIIDFSGPEIPEL